MTITLRFLATGDSQQSLALQFRIGPSTIGKIIRETCEEIWAALNGTYISPPKTTSDWVKISESFDKMWHFPNSIGAIDGKQIAMECPKNAGTAFFSSKNFHSIVLLAVCDANYCFTLVDVGAFGRSNDSGVLVDSLISRAFEKDRMKLPGAKELNRKISLMS